MGIRLNSKTAGGFRIGGKLVGGIRNSGKIIWESAPPVPKPRGVMYMTANGRFYSVDRDTGSATVIDNTHKFNSALAIYQRKTYSGSANLNTIDISDGSLTRVGSATNFGYSGPTTFTIYRMASHGGDLVAIMSGGSGTYAKSVMNISDGTGSQPSGAFNRVEGMESDGDNLYILMRTGSDVNRDPTAFYTLNNITNATSRIGSTTYAANTEIGGLVWDGADMYTADTTNIYTINLTTGVLTLVGPHGINLVGVTVLPDSLMFVPAPREAGTTLATFTLNATHIASQTAGSFSLSWSFTHDGQTYNITRLFTSPTVGIQMTFATDAQATAFKEADFVINTGIAGQGLWGSAEFDKDPTRAVLSIDYFEGRYVANTAYTITISLDKVPGPPPDNSEKILAAGINGNLYSLSTGTGEAKLIVALSASGVSRVIAVGMTNIGNQLYAIGSLTAPRQLYTINSTTGVCTLIGSTGLSSHLDNLAYDGTNLYCVANVGGEDYLHTINKTTGAATRVPGAVSGMGIGTDECIGLAWDGTKLLATFRYVNGLHEVNRSTGRATKIGSSTNFGVGVNDMTSLVAVGDKLYGTSESSRILYEINKTGGTASQVGSAVKFGLTNNDQIRSIIYPHQSKPTHRQD